MIQTVSVAVMDVEVGQVEEEQLGILVAVANATFATRVSSKSPLLDEADLGTSSEGHWSTNCPKKSASGSSRSGGGGGGGGTSGECFICHEGKFFLSCLRVYLDVWIHLTRGSLVNGMSSKR